MWSKMAVSVGAGWSRTVSELYQKDNPKNKPVSKGNSLNVVETVVKQ